VRKPIEDLPPLLDPALFKDLKHLEKAVDQHRAWCGREWPVRTKHSLLEINSSYNFINIPAQPDARVKFYRKLALDYPVMMDFVPATRVIFKMIERAA